jgi:hypothetical protein
MMNHAKSQTKCILQLLSCLLSLYSVAAESNRVESDNLLKRKPVRFLENRGQMTDLDGKPVPAVWFKASVPGLDLYVTKKGLSYVFFEASEIEHDTDREIGHHENHSMVFRYQKVSMEMIGADLRAENVIREQEEGADFNYYQAHCPNGIKGVKQFGKVTILNVYPGIDWVLYNSTAAGFKYDFVVHPGADPSMITLRFDTREPVSVDRSGNLRVASEFGSITESTPYSFLMNSKKEVNCTFVVKSKSENQGRWSTEVGYQIGKFDGKETIVIDPQLVWSTLFGGTGVDGTLWLETDAAGNIFSCGYGSSPNFPLQNAGTYFEPTPSGNFILKFSNSGVLLWSTYYGGGMFPGALAIDQAGNVFVTGYATGTNFPVQNAGTFFQGATAGGTDAAIIKFDNNGNRLWATYYGGTSHDYAYSIDTDMSGNVFMSGSTTSTNFPVQNAGTYFGVIPTSTAGTQSFIVKFDNAGNRLWATYYSSCTINKGTCDAGGNFWCVGSSNGSMNTLNPGNGAFFQPVAAGLADVILLRFDNVGNLEWATYCGGSKSDIAMCAEADDSGNLFVVAVTHSTNFPLFNAGGYFQSAPQGQSEIAIMKFDSSGIMKWSTYFGGSKYENVNHHDYITIDECQNVYVSFESSSGNLPVLQPCDSGYFDTYLDTTANNVNDVFLTRFTNSGSQTWGTYIGGSGNDFRAALAVDHQENLFVTGEWSTNSTSSATATYPLLNPGNAAYFDSIHNGGGDDSYFLKFSIGAKSFSYPGLGCAGASQTLMPLITWSSPGGSFTSAPAGLNLVATTGEVILAGSQPGIYTIVHSGISCICPTMSTAGSATIQVLAAPQISVAGNQNVCKGNSVTYTAQGAAGYTWNNNASTQTPTLKLTPLTNATITVAGTGTNGCISTKSVSIAVNPCTSVDETNPENIISVFANPNNGNFIVESRMPIELTLVSVIGQELRRIYLNGTNDNRVQVTGLPRGIYFIGSGADKRLLRKVIVE